MENVEQDKADHPKIEVFDVCGEWFVRVVENRKENVTIFDLKTFAMAYANGQRIRLGLERITSIERIKSVLPENPN
jgi:cobalamin-dependent methionine synthase I